MRLRYWILIDAAILAGVFFAGYYIRGKLDRSGAPASTTSNNVFILPSGQYKPVALGGYTVNQIQITPAHGEPTHSTITGALSGHMTSTGLQWSDPTLVIHLDESALAGTYAMDLDLTAIVNIIQDKRGNVTHKEGVLTRYVDGKPVGTLAVRQWDIFVSHPTKKKNPLIAWKSNWGFGVSMSDFTDWKPAVTYSPLRFGRIRMPSVMTDTEAGGLGVQGVIWGPLHLGAYYTAKYTDFSDRSVKFSFTINH